MRFFKKEKMMEKESKAKEKTTTGKETGGKKWRRRIGNLLLLFSIPLLLIVGIGLLILFGNC